MRPWDIHVCAGLRVEACWDRSRSGGCHRRSHLERGSRIGTRYRAGQ
jgi:hypothetical protein